MGGMGEEFAGAEYLRSEVDETVVVELERVEEEAPWEGSE